MKSNVIQSLGLAVFLLAAVNASSQAPENLVTENIPATPPELRERVAPYLEFRTAGFLGWHPARREMLISTRFADTPQLHLVRAPGAARRQLTFSAEPVRGGAFQPRSGNYIVFTQDTGGGEFFQLYRYDLADARVTLLTDGKSRNTGAKLSDSGKWMACTSTRRNGRDNDIYVMDPARPESNRLVMEVTGGGWGIEDWSDNENYLIVSEYISINESRLYLADVRTGAKELLTPASTPPVSYTQARFSRDGRSIYITADRDSEFQRLLRYDIKAKQFTVITETVAGDIEQFEISPSGNTLAYVINDKGASRLRLRNLRNGKEQKPNIPLGVIGGLEWRETGEELGFTLTSAKSPSDAYSLDVKSGKLERWTESETGGLPTESFVEPELIRVKSFDGLEVTAFVYRPDPAKFPGKRPGIISIHGGPESQVRPVFQARNNYYLNELGIAIIAPNVRGSAGFGKTFLTLDNGFKREDSVKDIGAFLQWIRQDAGLDASRIAVMGGSYGGYMTLASMIHYNDQLRAGVDIVGISNFLTFLKNTQDYRRDLRRAEYGDERDPKMRDFLESISPTQHVAKLQKPLFVVQGKNDPRVPVTESEQMVKAIRDAGGKVWYLMAKDEGHGFAKKKNADFQFLATIQFLEENLLK